MSRNSGIQVTIWYITVTLAFGILMSQVVLIWNVSKFGGSTPKEAFSQLEILRADPEGCACLLRSRLLAA